MNITASCKLNGHDLSDIPVLNPAGWFGKTSPTATSATILRTTATMTDRGG
jgi:hypothetical protein